MKNYSTERFTHGGNVYDFSPVKAWLDFSANINPLGLSAAVREAIIGNLPQIVNYPDPDAKELIRAISRRYHAKKENIVLGNGATELFYLVFFALRLPTVLIYAPAFSEYERAALAAKTAPVFLPLSKSDNFALPVRRTIDEVAKGTAIIFGNPNNPTGTLAAADIRDEILTAAQKSGSWIIVDESFLDFIGERGTELSFMPFVEKYPRLVVVRSLTKFYAVPGLRLGFAVASAGFAAEMNAAKDVWNVNLLAQAAGVAALNDEEYAAATVKFVAEEKDYLERKLGSLAGLKVYPPTVNFILLEITSSKTAGEVAAKMREEGILVRDCGNYRALSDKFMRVAVRSRSENEMLVEKLADALK